MSDATDVILAISNFQIVGCLYPAQYRGAEEPWPHGWAELLNRGIQFDQVDVDLPSAEMAAVFVEHFKPSGVSCVG